MTNDLIRIKQLNCGKRLPSTLLASQWKDCDVAFLQEPNRGGLKTLAKHGKLFSTANSRSAILVTAQLDCTLVPQFSDKDFTTIQIEKQNIMLCSAYHDILLDVWPQLLDDLVTDCQRKNRSLVICSDLNAHSTLWNCPTTDGRRGDTIEQVIIDQQLYVHNLGDKPTFTGGQGSSIVDVTLSNDPILIRDWVVSDESSLSDHRVITFTLGKVEREEQILKRNISRVQWNAIANELKELTPEPGTTWWTPESLDEACTAFSAALQQSLDKHAPPSPPAKRYNYWWNDECQNSKTAAHRAERHMRDHRTPENVAAEKAARHAYDKAIYVAKRQAWRKFIEEVQSLPEMARVNKIMKLSNGPTHELGLVQNENGELSSTKQESLECMLKEHFPNSKLWEQDATPPAEGVEIEEKAWLTQARFRTAVKSFKKGKTPGPDEFRAECLAALHPKSVEFILDMFNASISLGYVPWEWRKVKVIFLPKAGKDDYTNRRSFRPISLMSVLFKTLERLVLWHLEETTLHRNPIHHNQFGFRKGRSTDHALSKVVNYIEKGINSQRYVLGVFCDIAGAFDNAKLESIAKTMLDRGVSNEITEWYKHFLHNRQVSSSLGTAEAAVKPGKGTPQGGVLSAILAWNLIFDELLKEYDNSPILSIGFADDGTLLITGIDIPTMYAVMQEALSKATAWAEQHGLSFCPKKTNAVLFTRRNNMHRVTLPSLTLNGEPIPNVSQVKLLGVTLTRRLTWSVHVEDKIKQCKAALMRLRPIIGKTWSPKPEYIRWIYTGVVLPILTYGCAVWAREVSTSITLQGKLKKLQRLGMTSIAPTRRSTPTAGLELVYNLPPLHLIIQETATNTYLRMSELHEAGEWLPSGKTPGHLRYLRLQAEACGISEITNSDEMQQQRDWEQHYVTSIDEHPQMETGTRVYTDGSLYKNASGAGAYIEINSEPRLTISERLQPCTVFQSELRAIKAACDFLNKEKYSTLLGRINFYIDNQAAIKALESSTISSALVLETKQALQELGSSTWVKLNWIKAHIGHPGNELADQAAKAGSQSTRYPKNVVIKTAHATIKQAVRRRRDALWQEEWNAEKECRQTKLLVPEIAPQIWRTIRRERQKCVSSVARFLTGHTFMRRHDTITKIGRAAALDSEDILCRLCLEGEETPIHLVTECPCLNQLRLSTLYSWQLDRPPPWTKELLIFIQDDAIRALEESTDLPQ